MINVKLRDGSLQELNMVKINRSIEKACKGIENVSPSEIAISSAISFYDGITTEEIDSQVVLTAQSLTQTHPNYSFAASRLQQQILYQKIFGSNNYRESDIKDLYRDCFKAYLENAIEIGILNPELINYVDAAKFIVPERDKLFKYNGTRIICDRYLIKNRSKEIIELPQWMFLRIAIGLSLNEPEDKRISSIKTFYDTISSFDYMPSTPTLFNSGTVRPQLSSCYLTTVGDDLHEIFKNYSDVAQLSKWAGGVGTDWTMVRGTGSKIVGTNGESQGIIPWLKIVNDIAVAVNQGGKRKGSHCAYLESWHIDIEDFLELRKNVGDERRRTHDLNTANWIPDLLMKRIINDKTWTLFSPNQVPELHDLYGKEFDKAYEQREKEFKAGKIKGKELQARDLWKKMLLMLFETGHPWLTFKDPINIRNPQKHVGVVHSSNLCTEITLNSSLDEYAVCNIGSINLSKHVLNGSVDYCKLADTVTKAVRMLDNVIDNGFYPLKETEISSLTHRAIGVGCMGFQEMLYMLDINYESNEQIDLSSKIQEFISYHAINASCDLASERGKYSSYDGSLWSQGIFPFDSFLLLKNERGTEFGKYINIPKQTMDWDSLKDKVARHGLRNSNLMAIAPTATISYITGTTQAYEPLFKQLYIVSNLSGELTIVNEYLVSELEKRGLWNENTVKALRAADGNPANIIGFPEDLLEKYKEVFDIDQKFIIDGAIARSVWIDQSQSVNIYFYNRNNNIPSGKLLSDLYLNAWKAGIKTTYYLRTVGASQSGKVTVTRDDAVMISAIDQPKSCLIDNPGCESCQ